MAPTKTLPLALEGIFARQNTSPAATVTVAPAPASGSGSDSGGGSSGGGGGLDTGAIVGIVIGVVVAILLIIWAVRSLSTPKRAPDSDRQGWYDDAPRHSHHSHRSRSHHSHRRHRSRTPRPVVLEEKDAYVRRPSATYVYPDTGAAGRSRSQHRSRSRSQGYYAAYQ